MKIKCDYCGSFIDDTDQTCPNCGAVNEHVMRSADGIPKTIEELKAFCQSRQLPLEQMRFFIGINYTEPKAFGIYKDDDGNFIVYKNKGDGTRSERYRGKDEAYAVNEIYQKLKSEIQIRRDKYGTSQKKDKEQDSSESDSIFKWLILPHLKTIIIGILIIAACIIFFNLDSNSPNTGYYNYNGNYYYCQNDRWYGYDYVNDYWYATAVDSALSDHYSDYWAGSSYNSSYNVDDFSDSPYYSAYSDSSSDYNDDWDGGDWDWGGGDWDAGDTDWDTDW